MILVMMFHVGTMSFGKMEGDGYDKNIAYMLQDEADGSTTAKRHEGDLPLRLR